MGLLRVLLALSVVIGHTAPFLGMTMVGGKLAVQGFFIVSGFYMSLILNEKYPADGTGTWLFYSNRFLRIYPMYWAVLAIALAQFVGIFAVEYFAPGFFRAHFHSLTAIGAAKEFWNLSADKIAFITVTNVTLVGMDLSYFLRFDLDHLAFTSNWLLHEPYPFKFYFVSQAWTLGIEVAVYALAPFVFRRSTRFLVTALVASFALRAVAVEAGYHADPWNYRFLPFEFGLFVAGALLYRLYKAAPDLVGNRAIGLGCLATGIASILGYQALRHTGGGALGFEMRELLFLIVFAACIPATFAISKGWTADRWIGELSYPIYLCHLLVVQLCNGQFGYGDIKPVAGTIIAAIALTIAIERPLDRFRQARFRSRTAAPPAWRETSLSGISA